MINSCRAIHIGDLLFVPAPNGAKITRRMVIQVIDPSHDHAAIDTNKPTVEKATNPGSGNNHSKVRYDKSLGGEVIGLFIV
jgi:hypothetical protein